MLMRTRTGLVRPFLKWAGNKYRILDRVWPLLPAGRRLVEPFVGSGALFLNTAYDRYLLADSNPDLIVLYQTLQQEGDDFIDACRPLFTADHNTAPVYYRLRHEFNACTDARRRAVLFVYLNRHGYNGLCRYNAQGHFNVPFGRYKQPYFPAEEMRTFHHKARRARFLLQDFATTLRATRRGDVVYCDPPYAPLSVTASFTAYHSRGFSLRQQEELAALAQRCAGRGIPVLISNHATDFTEQLYARAEQHSFSVRRSISCLGNRRQPVRELLALFDPLR